MEIRVHGVVHGPKSSAVEREDDALQEVAIIWKQSTGSMIHPDIILQKIIGVSYTSGVFTDHGNAAFSFVST